MRFIAQMEMAECGAACLAMVLDHHGHRAPLSQLREACAVSRDGVSVLGIVHAARRRGLEAAGVKASVEALADIPMPAILHWEFKHFVVLERISRQAAVIVDPASGRRRVSRAELERAFTGVAISLSPGEDFVLHEGRAVSLTRYMEALRTVSPAVVRMLGATLLLNILSVAAPAGTQVLLDHVLKPQRDHWLLPLVAVLLVASLLRVVLRLMRDRALLLIHLALDMTLFTQFVDRMVMLPATFFDQRTTGDLMQRVEANRSLRDLTSHLVTAILDGFLLVSFGALMFAYNTQLASIVMVLSLLRLLLTLAVRSQLRQAVAQELTHTAREQTVLVEALRAPEMVKAFNMEQRLLARFTDRLTDRLNAQAARNQLASLLGQLTVCFDTGLLAIVLYVGGRSVLAEDMSLGVLAGFLSMQAFLTTPLEALVFAYQQLEQTRGILDRIDDVLDTTPCAPGTVDPGRLSGAITFEHVFYRYAPQGPWTLEDVNLTIRPGEKIALVGRSGQGKSTVLRMLLGIIHPEKGTVAIDGHELATLGREAFLRQVGVVLQEPFVIDDTVYENVAFRRPTVSPKDVLWALRVACLEDVVAGLPQGIHTRLANNGERLSGGQRQRLALARALAARPRILVLDEATSALDRENEAQVEMNLRELACTRIVVAHRIDTVRDADRIVVIANGRVVQIGHYEVIRRMPGPFADLSRQEAYT